MDKSKYYKIFKNTCQSNQVTIRSILPLKFLVMQTIKKQCKHIVSGLNFANKNANISLFHLHKLPFYMISLYNTTIFVKSNYKVFYTNFCLLFLMQKIVNRKCSFWANPFNLPNFKWRCI